MLFFKLNTLDLYAFDFPQGTLLKPNMVTSGTKCESQADPQEVKKIKTLLKD